MAVGPPRASSGPLFRRDWLIEQPTPPLAARRALPPALPRARFGDVFAGPPGLRASARTDTVSVRCRRLKSFPPDVVPKLKTYVYRLIDPRNGETFYVGKGRGNRVFAHIHDELSQEGDELSDKLKRIREIRVAGFEVAHVIHRHGMDEATAFEVEAALMDAYPGLTNIAGGTGSSDYGAMHAQRDHPPLLGTGQRTSGTRPSSSASTAARPRHRSTRPRATPGRSAAGRQCRLKSSSPRSEGSSLDAFVADDWLPATAADFPGHEDAPGRLAFVGQRGPSRAASGVRGEARSRTSTASAAPPTRSSTHGPSRVRVVDGPTRRRESRS